MYSVSPQDSLTNALQRDKHYLFEPPLSPHPEADGTAIASAEWLDVLSASREMGLQNTVTDVEPIEFSSQLSTPTDTRNGGTAYLEEDDDPGQLDGVNIPLHGTGKLRRSEPEDGKRGKRFSRRQSKGGLAAVF
jgi:hypothetical protein